MKINAVNILKNITSKPELFVYLGEKMEQEGFVDNALDFTESMYLREEEATTAVGRGFAIPHGKSEKITEPIIVFSRIENGFKWEEDNNEKITDVFALAIPKGDYKLHLSLISELANVLSNEKFVTEIKQANTQKQITDVLANYFKM